MLALFFLLLLLLYFTGKTISHNISKERLSRLSYVKGKRRAYVRNVYVSECVCFSMRHLWIQCYTIVIKNHAHLKVRVLSVFICMFAGSLFVKLIVFAVSHNTVPMRCTFFQMKTKIVNGRSFEIKYQRGVLST